MPTISERWMTKGVVLFVYAALTIVFALSFVFERGVFAETGWFVNTQWYTGMSGLLWPDPSRPFMQTPITLGYWLSGGSYFGIYLLYALTILFTGYLTQKILLIVAPDQPALAFLAGALAIVHGGDQATNHFGMIVVRQGIVGILLAALMAIRFMDHGRFAVLFWVFAGQAVALWSYDPALGPILGVGLLFLVFHRFHNRRWRIAVVAWAIAPLLYSAQLVYRYVINEERSYQSNKVISPTWSQVSDRLDAYLEGGFQFWTWADHWLAISRNCVSNLHAIVFPWVIPGVAVFALGLFYFALRRPTTMPPARKGLLAVAVGATIVLAASYSPWFFVSDGGGNWRTQFYSAPAAATLLALGLVAIGQLSIRRIPLGWIVAAPVSLVIVGFGLYAGLVSQLEHGYRWHVYRQVVKGIVEAAPQLKNHTLVVETGIPDVYPVTICQADPFPDPFQDNWWFEVGVRVLYPRTYLSGVYYFADGRPSKNTYELVWTTSGVEQRTGDVQTDFFPYSEVVVFRFDPVSGSELLSTIPEALLKGVVAEGYDPRQAISGTQIPEETMKKIRVEAIQLP